MFNIKRFFSLSVLGSCLVFTACGANSREKTVLTAPFGPLAYPFVYMAGETGSSYELEIWRNPDQLRAMITGGQADFFALPTNVAAIYSNKGAGISLMSVSVWSVLWMVSRDSMRTSLTDFKGEEIVMPFRGDMPHIVFETVSQKRGLDPEKDFHLRYVATPQDAVQQLLLGRVRHAVLCEPDLSILMYRAKQEKNDSGAPLRFFRTVDLQEEWADIFDTGKAIPIGGVAATASTLENTHLAQSFHADYTRAVRWCTEHPEETAAMVSRFFDGVPGEPVASAIGHVDQHVETAAHARSKLESFFTVLLESNPATVGGKLPESGFYWGE